MAKRLYWSVRDRWINPLVAQDVEDIKLFLKEFLEEYQCSSFLGLVKKYWKANQPAPLKICYMEENEANGMYLNQLKRKVL